MYPFDTWCCREHKLLSLTCLTQNTLEKAHFHRIPLENGTLSNEVMVPKWNANSENALLVNTITKQSDSNSSMNELMVVIEETFC